MHELALYRKYRPAKFKDVLGQDHIVEALQSSVEEGKVSHAYLFVGSRGTGKTSVARIFAKAIGVSENDMYEIDAASNRGIDDIKELRDGVRTLPFDSKYKVYIIDEVHMLSKDAWGALLKTLEEPPAHAIFILATTEFHKVPDTIISRCQVFTFRRPGLQVLKKILGEVSKSEGYDLDQGSLELLAILGDGSFRNALGELQKVLNAEDRGRKKSIKREDIEKVTGAPRSELVNDFLSALVDSNAERGLAAVRRAAKANLDMDLYFKLIIEKFRLGIMQRYASKLPAEAGAEMSEEDSKFIKALVERDTNGVLRSKALAILLAEYQNLNHAFIKELPLELALLEILKTE